MDDTTNQQDEGRDITAPPSPTHDATTPPGNPQPDERAVREGEDKLEQAGGGH